jgi:hypothetical protein
MIRVPRDRVRPPTVLSAADGIAARERLRAERHFKPPPASPTAALSAPGGSFEFKVYKDEAVKAKLEALFHGKCAYCESYYAGVHPVDVEHWRPKAEVAAEHWDHGADLSGYWFLASDWENLLPSCIDCNRARNHREVTTGTTQLLGKANRFPVEPGSRRATSRAEIAGERPLLLHPCEDEPSHHLECDPGDQSILRPRNSSEKGRVSIEVYGLNRAGLVVARRERLATIRLHLNQLMMLLDLEKKATTLAERVVIDTLKDYELQALASFRKDTDAFTMMSRAIIDDFMRHVFAPPSSTRA